jgi:pimeloyl-ACP methyl ester carboxylesterase
MTATAHPLTVPLLLAALVLALSGAGPAAAAEEQAPDGAETVILLHGLGRSARSMAPLADALAERGYRVHTLDYPSRSAPIEQLAGELAREVEACCSRPPVRVHFVGHSLGGILVRAYLARSRPPRLGRVVMLAPPNQGSELVDGVRDNAVFRWLAGPAAHQLGTGEDGLPRRLGPVDFELGVLTGDRSWSPLRSWLIPGDDDGTVAVASAQVAGMSDFRVVPETHTFIMRSDAVAREVWHFLQTGRFSPTGG